MKSPEIVIRHAGPEDIERLISLLKFLFAIEKDFSFNEAIQQKGLNMMLENFSCCLLVAEISGQVVGMCSGQLTISTAEGGPALLVEDVVVEEKWRGRGIARQLLDRLAEWGVKHNAFRMQLLADRTNNEALKFYRHLGWKQTQLICLRKYR